MINLAKVLSGKPILLTKDLYFYQPTLQEIVDMTEPTYWAALNVWILKREDLIQEETEQSLQLSDFEIWKLYMLSAPELKRNLALSCLIFLKTKIEFFEVSNTIIIGEKGSSLILDEKLYNLLKDLCTRIVDIDSASDTNKQYEENNNMSEMEKKLLDKMKASEEKLKQMKNKDDKPEEILGDRILGLVAIGNYTFEQVYNMTMLQFNRLLKKYIDIQGFEIRSMLSPYINSENDDGTKFWLNN